jgi:DNA modification methylase
MSQKKIALKQKEIKVESSSDEETNSEVETSSDEESDNESGEKSRVSSKIAPKQKEIKVKSSSDEESDSDLDEKSNEKKIASKQKEIKVKSSSDEESDNELGEKSRASGKIALKQKERKNEVNSSSDEESNIKLSGESNNKNVSFLLPKELLNNYFIGDNLLILKKIKTNSIDFIYLDPPYNTGRNFFDYNDKFKSIEDYVIFMKKRFTELYRILKKSGSIAIHIEPRISPYFRIICDEIFGLNKFQNEIIWKTGGNAKNTKKLNRWHDNILIYSKSNKYTFNPIYFPYDSDYKKNNNVKLCEIHNKEYVTTAIHNSQPDINPRLNLQYKWNGHKKQWYVTKEKMKNLHDDNRLIYNKHGLPRIKRFLDEMQGIPLRDIWTDINNIQHGEKMDYATQKPIKLLDRILQLYTNENDICLDPFAGSGVLGRSCIINDRNYILIDINKKGKELFIKSIQ